MAYERYKLEGLMELNGLPSFEEISEMDSEVPFCDNEKIGNYRLSLKRLQKLASDDSLTSSALILYLYLLQICDAHNFVLGFNYREFTELKRNDGKPVLSVKSFYNALKLLKKSGYIKYSDTAYKTRCIRILENEIGHKDTFLNLNYDSLVFGTIENDMFLNFPVKAKLLYLKMLSRAYSIRKHGSRVNLGKLAKELNITDRAMDYYLSQIECLLGKIPRTKNKFTGKKRNTVTIPISSRIKLAPKDNLREGQANYFDRIFNRILSSYDGYNVTGRDYYTEQYLDHIKTQFFVAMKNFCSLGPAKVFKVFEYVISEAAGLTFGALNDALTILSNATVTA